MKPKKEQKPNSCAKLRESDEYKANMAQRSRDYYQKPENKEKHSETVKKYYAANKEKIKKIIFNLRKIEDLLVVLCPVNI